MPTIRKTLPTTWHADGRITATGETDVLAENTSDREGVGRGTEFYWAVTNDDTAPAFGVHLGHQVVPGQSLSMKLGDTRRLWLASRAVIVITQTTDA